MDQQHQLEQALEGIATTRHVIGATICTKDGRIAATVMPPFYETYVLEEACNVVATTASTVRELGVKVEVTAYSFGEMRLLVKDLKKGFLVVLCEAQVNLALLNIGMRVTEKKIATLLASGLQVPVAKDTSHATESATVSPATKPTPEEHDVATDDWSKSVILFGEYE